MSDKVPASFRQFLADQSAPERTLLVVNWDAPEQIDRLLEKTVEPLPVDLQHRVDPDRGDNTVVLLEEGEVVATSTLEALQRAVLLVNVDLYKSGLSGIEKYEAPDVFVELDETLFTLRGYPAAAKEKLLLVVMSRFIEKRAIEVDAGRLDVGFQNLSRVRDEYGTREVYARLADTGVDVHVYGVPDADPALEGITVHRGETPAYRRSWVVVFRAPAHEEPAALLAVETGANEWDAIWTYDRERVRRLGATIESEF
jgi:hypothetical protein